MKSTAISKSDLNWVCHPETVFFYYRTTSGNMVVVSVKREQVENAKAIDKVSIGDPKDPILVKPVDLKITTRSAYSMIMDAFDNNVIDMINKRTTVEKVLNIQPGQTVFTCRLAGM